MDRVAAAARALSARGTTDARDGAMDEPLVISPRDAHEKVAAGATLLDVVGDSVWRSLREVAAGSMRLPPSEGRERLDQLPRDHAYVAYCT
jgi:rhodanese-related sulfurtransferase